MQKVLLTLSLIGSCIMVFLSCEQVPVDIEIGPLYKIDVTPSVVSMVMDSTIQFTAIGMDENMNIIPDLLFTWESEDSSIVSIDENGLANGIRADTTIITVSICTVPGSPATVVSSAVTVIINPLLVTDVDGNIYTTVKIGNQVWMVENLRVTHYRDSTAIPNMTSSDDWTNTNSGAYCYYNNNNNNLDTYGVLYNWYTVHNSRAIAPEGWHVPTDEEWKELEISLGMSQDQVDGTGWRGNIEGSKLASSKQLWDYGALQINCEFGSSGFTALPAGYRNPHNGDSFNITEYVFFWSATDAPLNNAWARFLNYYHLDVNRQLMPKRCGYAVRLLKD